MFRLNDGVTGLGSISIPVGVNLLTACSALQAVNPLAFWLRCISLFHRSRDNGT